MSQKKPDKGIWSGIIGGLVASFFNQMTNAGSSVIEDLDEDCEIETFRTFSDQEGRKRKGYKLKYDINESKVKPKIVNLVQVNKYLYAIKVHNGKVENAIKYSGPYLQWREINLSIYHMLKNNLHQGVIMPADIEPRYWVYSKEESNEYRKIIITDEEINNDNNICESYICLNINEAQDLAKEMKRFYHNHMERVAILEEISEPWARGASEHKAIITKTVPNYYKLVEMTNEIGILKYHEISEYLKNMRFNKPLNILYTLLSLGIQLYNDDYYKDAIVILESLVKVDKSLLDESGLEKKSYEYILDGYIGLRKEDKIINLIKNNYQYRYYFIMDIAEKLYDLGLYKAANVADKILIEDSHGQFYKKHSKIYLRNLVKSYIRTGDDQGLKVYREKLIKAQCNTGEVDRYLNNKDIEGLGIKIGHFERNENWEEVIKYCNQYNKLIVEHPWKSMSERVDYEFKKINAYIQTKNYPGAWNSTCKSRMTLISNFDDFDCFSYLNKLETYMKHICLKQDYLIDAIYHHVLSLIYNDMFEFYSKRNRVSPIWTSDLFLKDMIQKTNTKELWAKIEAMIKIEYESTSSKTIRNINTKVIRILEENKLELVLDGPKKYFPTIIDRDFNIN